MGEGLAGDHGLAHNLSFSPLPMNNSSTVVGNESSSFTTISLLANPWESTVYASSQEKSGESLKHFSLWPESLLRGWNNSREKEELGNNIFVLLSTCGSNSTEAWQMTEPICSTRFRSFFLFLLVLILLTIITLWTIVGNVMVLCALYRFRTLRTMSNCLIGNLAISDLLLAITILPISTSNDLLGYWVFGSTMCTIWLCIDVLYCTASIWGLCTIAFDRYTATVFPMWYHDKRSTKRALIYIVFVWVFSIIISIAPFIGWRDMIPSFFVHNTGINRQECILFSTESYVIYSAMGSFLLPFCLMTFLYIQIFVVLRRQSNNLKRKSGLTASSPNRPINGCPEIVFTENSEVRGPITRDITASTWMTPDDDDDDEEEASEDKVSKIVFNLQDETSHQNNAVQEMGKKMIKEQSTSLLRHNSNESLDVEMRTFTFDANSNSKAESNFLSVSTSDIPHEYKKPRSVSMIDTLPVDCNGSSGQSYGKKSGEKKLSAVTSRSRSATALSALQPGGENSRDLDSRRSSTSLKRLSLPWQMERNSQLTNSMKRRFELREQRATKRMLLIMACFFVCWVPFTLMYILRSLCKSCPVLEDHAAAFIIWLGYANSALNPVLYPLFNEDFRRAFKKLITLKKRKRTFSPRAQ